MNNEIVKKNESGNIAENIEIMPAVDILEDSDSYIMHFEVPGCNASSVKVEVENSILTVECASTLRRSKHPVMFKRVFRLSRAVEITRITASTVDGVLTLVLPKAEHVKPYRVPIS